MSELIDNRAHRIRTLKDIIKRFNAGSAVEEAKGELRKLMKEVDSNEIAAMEQELIAEGMPVEEVKSMCDAHSELLREFVVSPPEPDVAPGHPVDTMRRENAELQKTIAGMRALFDELNSLADDGAADQIISRCREASARLSQVDRHYQRKENLIFSILERHGISGPSKVMWGKDDEVRDALRAFDETLAREGVATAEWKEVAAKLGESALAGVTEMIFKEEKILIPMCLGAFTEAQWGEIREQSADYGYCLIDTPPPYAPPEKVKPEPLNVMSGGEISGDIVFPTGTLSFDQLLGIFQNLPVDLTFVDAENRVRFFSEGPKRVFARSPAIIGRKVEDCHPPKSVSTVHQIVEDFRNGRQDVAAFWIELEGRFIHIRYFAVRDGDGKFMGTLEMTQDVTDVRQLEGERRLLQYESPST